MNLKHLKSVSYGGKRLGSCISDSRRVSDASRKNSALSIAKKLSRLVGDVWDELDINSGSELMADKNKCKKFVDRMKSEIAKLGYTELSQEVFDYLEDWNNHSLNFVLKALNLFGNADDYYSYIIEHADRWIYTYNVFLMAYNGEFYDLKGNKVSDSRRVKDDKIEPFYYNFGESGRYDEDYEMYDEDYDVADYLMNEADLLESKYSVYENGGDTVENWEQCIRGYFDLVDKTDVKDVDSVFKILEDANFHILNWVLLLVKGTDKDVQYAIDFIFDDTDGWIQRNKRYVALRNVINEMGIA